MRNLLAVAITGFAVACTDGGAAVPPAYKAPHDRAAFKAFKAAMKSDWLDKPHTIGDAPKTMTAFNYQKSVEWNRKQLANKAAKRSYNALQKLKLGECVWQRLTEEIPDWARDRVPEAPGSLYVCNFTVHYQINPPHGDKLSVETKGGFFKQGRRFAYLGRFKHPY